MYVRSYRPPTVIVWSVPSGTVRLSEISRMRCLRSFPGEKRSVPSVTATEGVDPPFGVTPTEISGARSEEHTSELQSRQYLVCRLLLEKKKKTTDSMRT